MAWPFRGKPGRVYVSKDSPTSSAWIRAKITFRNLDNVFIVMLRARGPSERENVIYFAVDDVKVVEGACQEV